ncbi:hypothetical protein JOB18_020249 [Solea senegalensis]|uniref:Uncharacterized protein n=1 Tax=Solea senegalensis TaxID=28829 RepID=A0AAV6QXL8_SOLSE|nr:hypothetical protein JOB18_020249 [Solea senegalensis]
MDVNPVNEGLFSKSSKRNTTAAKVWIQSLQTRPHLKTRLSVQWQRLGHDVMKPSEIGLSVCPPSHHCVTQTHAGQDTGWVCPCRGRVRSPTHLTLISSLIATRSPPVINTCLSSPVL